MRVPVTVAAAVATVAALTATPFGIAPAQDGGPPECGTFVIVIETDARHIIDVGDEGTSPGDRRITRAHLLDEAGNRVGTSHILATVMPPNEDDVHPGLATIHDEFDNGTVLSTVMAIPPDHSDMTGLPDHDSMRTVTGGTGDFAHVSGTVAARTREDGARELTYALVCPH